LPLAKSSAPEVAAAPSMAARRVTASVMDVPLLAPV
jgi:hypothetical protein